MIFAIFLNDSAAGFSYPKQGRVIHRVFPGVERKFRSHRLICILLKSGAQVPVSRSGNAKLKQVLGY